VKESFKKYCIENALDGTQVGILWGNTDLHCPELKSYLEDYVDSKCEAGSTDEEDSEHIHLHNLNFPFFIDLYLLIKIIFLFEYCQFLP
jgi:hypothetical protein